MWLIIPRAPRPDFIQWPGRRLLAAVDAVAWPFGAILLLQEINQRTGLFGAAAITAASAIALFRVFTAIRRNERYGFTSALAFKIVGILILTGVGIKFLGRIVH